MKPPQIEPRRVRVELSRFDLMWFATLTTWIVGAIRGESGWQIAAGMAVCIAVGILYDWRADKRAERKEG